MTAGDARRLSQAIAPAGRCARYALAALAALAIGGCAAELDDSYGGSTRRYLSTSVNGVDVLAGMFADAGHQVSTRRTLITSSMERVQTIVWFPDDVDAPSDEVCSWFDDWLAADEDRTLVYVGRDFDAADFYWKKMAPQVSPSQQKAYRDRVGSEQSLRPPVVPDESMHCPWFAIDGVIPGDLHRLTGPWSQGIDGSKTELYLKERLAPNMPVRELLAAGGDVMAWTARPSHSDGGALIAVANGSFLLNLALVNHEHRKLAGKLIESVAPAGRVVFLESGPGGPPIDPPAGESALAHLFGTWPLGVILLHSVVLGIIFCFARWPIFGRAKIRRPRTPRTSGCTWRPSVSYSSAPAIEHSHARSFPRMYRRPRPTRPVPSRWSRSRSTCRALNPQPDPRLVFDDRA